MEDRPEIWRVSAEFDEATLGRLALELRALEYLSDPVSFAISLSEHGRPTRLVGPRGHLIIEADREIGITVAGTVSLVEELREKYCLKHPLSQWARDQSKKSS